MKYVRVGREHLLLIVVYSIVKKSNVMVKIINIFYIKRENRENFFSVSKMCLILHIKLIDSLSYLIMM